MLLSEVMEKYRNKTQNSLKLWIKSKQYLPGGNSRTTVFIPPYPIYVDRGAGCHIYDVDGNEYVDFLNNYTSLILGHAHPRILEAVKQQLEKGTAYAAPTELEYRHAKIICERVKSVKKIRYTNSGTEAIMNAIRAARAYTGRDKIVKCEGAYHGGVDESEISQTPALHLAGTKKRPKPVPDSAGIPESVVKGVIVIPYNDPESAEEIIKENKKDIAAVIVEPIMGRFMIPAKTEFLKTLRDITADYDIPLIFDEVITFRLSPGGGQEVYGVIPDLTVFGKIIGGGFPIGVFGGHEDIMAFFDPSRGKPLIEHSGTFNANPISLSAGIATLEELTSNTYERLNRMGEFIRTRLTRLFNELQLEARVTGLGSLFQIHTTLSEVIDYRSTVMSNVNMQQLIFYSLLVSGIFLAPRLMGCISTPMTEKEAEKLINAMYQIF
jgi:glutamate-1-semialdehyde 2,1-aminomutase